MIEQSFEAFGVDTQDKGGRHRNNRIMIQGTIQVLLYMVF